MTRLSPMTHSTQFQPQVNQRLNGKLSGLLLALLMPILAVPCSAQDWAAKMFEVTSHDFGSVARGSKVEYAFELTNGFRETVHIASVRSSCGCTSPRIVKDTLETYETGAIIAELNTVSFQGSKNATITVVIDQPYRAEVQLRVSAYIRSDVVLEPSEATFGDIEQGEAHEIPMTISYAGRNDWQVVDVRSASEDLEAELVETSRGNGRVGYRMVLRLRDSAPAGAFRTVVHVVTNDRNSGPIPILVEGRVRGAITASPAVLSFGEVTPGEPVTKKAILRGHQPFTVLGVSAHEASLTGETPEVENEVQFVPITLTASGPARRLQDKITIETSLGPVEVTVVGDIKE